LQWSSTWTRANNGAGPNAGLAPYMRFGDENAMAQAAPELVAKLAFWERVRAEFPYDVIRGLYRVSNDGKHRPAAVKNLLDLKKDNNNKKTRKLYKYKSAKSIK
jgi:hypothetical protein